VATSLPSTFSVPVPGWARPLKLLYSSVPTPIPSYLKSNSTVWHLAAAPRGLPNPDPLNNQTLDLYNLNTDFSQTKNVAAKNPQKVKEMKQMFIAEAKKHQVFPLDASVAARVIAPRPNITARSLGVRLHAANHRTAAGRWGLDPP